MATARTWTAPTRRKFLAMLETTGNVSEAVRTVRRGRSRAYALRAGDPAFAAAWDEAIETAIDRLERIAWLRAEEGSDRMLEFLLKAHRPGRYRDRPEPPIGLKLDKLTDAQLLKLASELKSTDGGEG